MANEFYNSFIQAIHDKERLVITYFSQKDQNITTRIIAPLDYGPRFKPNSTEFAAEGKDFLHFYDFDGSGGGHLTSKEPIEIKNIQSTDTYFDPADIVSLPKKHSWHIDRDWGIYS